MLVEQRARAWLAWQQRPDLSIAEDPSQRRDVSHQPQLLSIATDQGQAHAVKAEDLRAQHVHQLHIGSRDHLFE